MVSPASREPSAIETWMWNPSAASARRGSQNARLLQHEHEHVGCQQQEQLVGAVTAATYQRWGIGGGPVEAQRRQSGGSAAPWRRFVGGLAAVRQRPCGGSTAARKRLGGGPAEAWRRPGGDSAKAWQRPAVLPDLAQLRENGASGTPSRAFWKCLCALREKPQIWRILNIVKFYYIKMLTLSTFQKYFWRLFFVPPLKRPKMQKKIVILAWRIFSRILTIFLIDKNNLAALEARQRFIKAS